MFISTSLFGGTDCSWRFIELSSTCDVTVNYLNVIFGGKIFNGIIHEKDVAWYLAQSKCSVRINFCYYHYYVKMNCIHIKEYIV